MELSIVEESPKVKELPHAKAEAKENFEDSGKDERGKLTYKSIKTINFFPSNSYLSFEIYFKEIKVDEYSFNIINYVSCVLGVEDKGKRMEKELGNYLEDLPISPLLNPSL
ncbi:hypothetical protein M9H77_07575 [Catharanthus roseus]|uniref:Uncharacterized protein n=1 Tax=Catharanthus roseus TaxID=4058 RepID=A0ACC0BVA9_CATRO|nr:hypothetical protein M9H77_07575 [Catharanthus roseus]